jgi:hypothetical protein
VFWGGCRHDTFSQIYPDETFFLDVPQDDIPLTRFLIPALITTRNVIGAAYAAVFGVTIGLLTYSLYWRDDHPRPSGVLVPLLGIGDVLAHVVVAITCYATNLRTQFWVCVGLFALALAVNGALLARHLQLVLPSSKQRDKKYIQYRVDYPLAFWATAAASVFHFSIIQLTYSRFLGLRSLSATMRMNDIYRDAMSDYMRRRGGFTALFQDLPQLVLQVYLALFAANADMEVKYTILVVLLITLPVSAGRRRGGGGRRVPRLVALPWISGHKQHC